MDPILDRLGRLFRSLGSDVPVTHDRLDPDLQAAEEELNEYLRTGRDSPKTSGRGSQSFHQKTREDTPAASASLDADLMAAYAFLGLGPEASWDEVSSVHRALLKKHHPDRHAGHEANMRKATAHSQKIGQAFQKIKKHLGH
jgi:DnaJ-domain-containing protein 1